MNYVEYNIWTGKIHKVSSLSSFPTKSTMDVIHVDDPIIKDISDDKRSLESAFIGTNQKAYNKNGTIHLTKVEKEYTELTDGKINLPDVSVDLYTNNKLMDITINYSAIKTWYNHRMKEFRFAKKYKFEFEIQNKNFIKHIEFFSDDFLETFKTTVDLSDIKDLENIKISTKRLFQNYQLKIKKNKYYNLETNDESFNKASTKPNDKKNYNIIISKTTKKNTITIELIEVDISKIYESLDFYITGKDPNELYEILSIPIEDLWNKKIITIKTKCEIDNKSIWCNSKILNILFN